MIKGCDLSHWNTRVDYEAMVDSGVRFVCPKLGQGRLAKDAMFDTHRAGCNRLNVPWDFYWFCDYRYTGQDNVHNLISKADGDFGAGHPVMDLEFFDPWGPRPDGIHMRRFALDFLGELEALTGILAMFYSNRDVINQIVVGTNKLGSPIPITPADKAELLRHPLWLATDAPYGNPSPWSKYHLNQYDLDTIVPWSNSTIDWDEFNGTEAEYQEFYYPTTPPTQPPTPEKQVEILWREATDHPPAGWVLTP